MALLTELAHPTILPILAVESEGADMIVVTRGLGRYVTVYDMLSQARARGDKLATDVASAIATAVVHGSATAHRHGIVHGGIHPRSVLIDEPGGVHITDFAVGRALTTAVARGADAALWRGLCKFLAPELVLGDGSPASDGDEGLQRARCWAVCSPVTCPSLKRACCRTMPWANCVDVRWLQIWPAPDQWRSGCGVAACRRVSVGGYAG